MMAGRPDRVSDLRCRPRWYVLVAGNQHLVGRPVTPRRRVILSSALALRKMPEEAISGYCRRVLLPEPDVTTKRKIWIPTYLPSTLPGAASTRKGTMKSAFRKWSSVSQKKNKFYFLPFMQKFYLLVGQKSGCKVYWLFVEAR